MWSGGLVLGYIVVYGLGNIFKVILTARRVEMRVNTTRNTKKRSKCDFGRYNLTETTWNKGRSISRVNLLKLGI